MIVNEYLTVQYFCEDIEEELYVKCYVYSYEETEGSFDFWEMSDVDYRGESYLEWEIRSIRDIDGKIVDFSLSDKEEFEVEKMLIKLVKEMDDEYSV